MACDGSTRWLADADSGGMSDAVEAQYGLDPWRPSRQFPQAYSGEVCLLGIVRHLHNDVLGERPGSTELFEGGLLDSCV